MDGTTSLLWKKGAILMKGKPAKTDI